MLLNFGKCKCLHTGHGNFDINYNMGNTILGTTVIENDLVVTISDVIIIIIIIVIIIISITVVQVSEQCSIAASKEGNTISCHRRTNLMPGLFSFLYLQVLFCFVLLVCDGH